MINIHCYHLHSDWSGAFDSFPKTEALTLMQLCVLWVVHRDLHAGRDSYHCFCQETILYLVYGRGLYCQSFYNCHHNVLFQLHRTRNM